MRIDDEIKSVMFLLENGHHNEALLKLRNLAKCNELGNHQRLPVLQSLAFVCKRLGLMNEAERWINAGLEVDGRYAPLHNTYGLLLAETNRFEDAIFHLRMACNCAPGVSRYREDIVKMYRSLGYQNPEAMVSGAEERMYFHPDPDLKIPCNDYDLENVRRHVARYEFAASHLNADASVLDAACGSGYGSTILATKAAKVTSIDIDAESIAYAAKHHGAANIFYQTQDLDNLKLPLASCDAVISLETIEHLADPRNFLNAIVRVLKDDGIFIVSTPVSLLGGPSPCNPFHLLEYTRQQFESLLDRYFAEYELFIEHLDSRIEPLGNSVPERGFYLALCRNPLVFQHPVEGDLRTWLQETPKKMPSSLQGNASGAFPKYRPIEHLGLIMAKGSDPRDYGTPLGLGAIAAFVEERLPGFRVSVARSVEELLQAAPDLVGISSVSSTYGHARDMARMVKERLGVPIILGGPHISHLPSSLDPLFLAGVIGEGEETVLELIQALNSSRPMEEVPGLVIINGSGSPAVTASRPAINLDNLPFARRSENPLSPDEATLFTSRGCPYHCAFCSSSIEPYRAFSAEYVVEEIEWILRTMPFVTKLYFLDDLFVADRARFRKIVELVEEKGLNNRFSARGFVRADLMDWELASLLKRMNFAKVRFGAESGSEKILRLLKSGSVSVADNQRCVDICLEASLPVSGSFVFGAPGETRQDILETFSFIERNRERMDVEGFYILMPLPGTPMWEAASALGEVSPKMDWSRLNLDMTNPDFDWHNFIYFNDAMRREEFVELVRSYLGLPPLCAAPPREVITPEIKLNIGSGSIRRPGFLSVDIRPLPNVDIQSAAWNLPFDEFQVSEIYSRHSLEHYTRNEGRMALREWHRVLRKDGRLHLIVPNIEFHMEQWRSGDREWAMAGFWGWQEHEDDLHKWGYTWCTLQQNLSEAGFTRIRNLTGLPDSQEKDVKHLEIIAWKE